MIRDKVNCVLLCVKVYIMMYCFGLFIDRVEKKWEELQIEVGELSEA